MVTAKELEIKTGNITASFPRNELDKRSKVSIPDCYGLNPPIHLLHADKDYHFARYSYDAYGKEGDRDNLEDYRDKGWMPALASEHGPLIKDSGYEISADRIHYLGLVMLCKPKMRNYNDALEEALEDVKNSLEQAIKKLL